ncbi:MAG: UDP-N-acetylglucosamine 4,6-dehydratase (inverting) [Candidatus Omnitrophota bacterium]|nr:UDP-N-acetylglucosamine 4,6-dehydratase (inverting) [Candidatus Omnitrophota bacterium]
MKNADIFKDKIVLITGGTGSFGQKFTEIVLKYHKPCKLIIFSRDEMKQFEMSKIYSQEKYPNIRYFLGDVRDPDRLHRAFYNVDIVVHAAALKIVPYAEFNPFEAVKTNIMGAENVINIAIDNGVKKVIALSTDKAANPVNLYGATKLCAEKMFIAANNYRTGKPFFSVVRYGNVLGSRGSAVPFFKECRKSGVVPITDPRMTRFFITLEEGVNFVISSIKEMKGGEIFIPKMRSIKITDLARSVCPGCRQKTIGIRPGEKLHEILVPKDDGIYTYEYKDKFVTYPYIIVRKNGKDSGRALGFGFDGYSSDTNKDWYSIEDMRKMINKEVV